MSNGVFNFNLLALLLSDRGRPGGVGPPSVNLGPPNISENTGARQLKLKTPLDIVKYSPRVQTFFSARGRTGGHIAPNVIFLTTKNLGNY